MRRTRLGALAAGALSLSSTLAAHATVLGDARIPTWEQSHFKEGDVATRALYLLAVCVRHHRLEQVEKMLGTRPDSAEESAAVPLIRPPAVDQCLMRASRLLIRNRDLLRGAFAEAIYNGRKVRPRTPETLPFDVPSLMPLRSEDPQRRNAGRLVAACAVQRAPAAAHEVLQFNPGAIGELRALKALDPAFLSCLRPGESLRISRLAIRAELAEALYQAWKARPDRFSNKM
jgi:hypothetical protein